MDDAEAAATAAGTPLAFTNWGAFSGSVLAGNTQIRNATGQAGDRVALKSASWASLMAMLNPAVPATLPGPSAPDFNAESVTLFGITFFHSPLSDADLQFNTKSLRKSEKAPDTVTATNVALMGRDIGVLGATIHLPLYPDGHPAERCRLILNPTPEDEARLVQAVVAKAVRILSLIEAPLGVWGEMTDMGMASVKPDWQIRELLFGLHYSGMPVPEVSADMVIRMGLQTDPASFPTDKLSDVERAIAAARSWIAHDLQGFGIA